MSVAPRHRARSAPRPVRRSRPVATVLAVLALVLTGWIAPASADTISSSLGMDGRTTVVAGSSTVVDFWLVQTSDDGRPNCNVNPGTLRLAVAPAVTVTAPTLVIRDCGQAAGVPVTFSGATPGEYVVTASMDDVRGGSFTSATFTLTVAAPADTTAPVLALPGPLTVEATGPSGAPAAWTASAYDEGDAASTPVTCTPASGSTVGLGTTTVTCTSVDSRGNTATGTFGVTVVDTTGPVMSPQTVTAEATSGGGAVVTLAVTAHDLVDGPVGVLCQTPAGDLYPLGTTEVGCSASDSRGNGSTTTATVTVADTIPPSISVQDLTVEATSAAGAVVEYVATAADAVSGPVPVVCGTASGAVFPLGTTTVHCEATDAAGNTGYASFQVTVADTTAPTLTLQSVTVEATGPSGAVAAFATSAHDDVDGELEVSCSPTAGSLFALGTTTVACSSTDAAGQTASGELTVTVVDTTPPVLDLTDLVLEATGPDGVVATPIAPSATDLVDGVLPVDCGIAPDTLFPLGVTEVACSVEDRAGNPASGTWTIRVVDTTPPVLQVQDLVQEATGPDGAVVTFAPVVTDAVSPDLVAGCAPASGSTFGLGSTPVSCSATDAAGNTGVAAFVVTVEDTTAPAYAPADVVVEATGADGAVATWGTTAHDLVEGPITASCTPASGSVFPIGTTTVECSVADSLDNRTTAFLTVTVEDTVGPELTLPGTVVAEATGLDGADVTFRASAVDLVDGETEVDCRPASDSRFALGSTTVTCSSRDAQGNTTEGSFEVLVQDTTGPVVSVASRTVEAAGPDGAVVDLEATARDAVDGDRPVICVPASGSTFPLGETTVTCESFDSRDNRGVTEVTVTVGDTTAPALTLVDVVAEATGPLGAEVTYVATAVDVVDGDVDVTCDPPSGSLFAIGATTVGCSASDTRGNTAEDTLEVLVRDTTAPRLTLTGATVEATGPNGATATFTATAEDLVDGDVTVACDYASGATFPVGTTTVACTATDAAGNTGSGELLVVVTDTTAPDLTLPVVAPQEATGAAGAVVAFEATGFDLVDEDVPVVCAPASGSMFPLGATEVSCSAEDSRGNRVSRSFEVTVVDTTAPVVTVTPVTVEATSPDGAAVAYTATAVDLVDGTVPVTCTPAPGSVFPLGASEVECEAVDAAGNWAVTRHGGITVVDTTAPTLSVPGSLTVTATSAAGAAVYYAVSATDLADPDPLVACSVASGAVVPLGTTTVTCTATDASGNTAQRSFTVTVQVAWSGLAAPISVDGRAAFKSGSTIPVKFSLTGASAGATGAPATLSVAKVGAAGGEESLTVLSTSAADSGNQFRVSSGQYVYNLSTKGWGEGVYVLRVDLGDGVDRATQITVRR